MRNWQEEDRRALREQLREAEEELRSVADNGMGYFNENRRLHDAIGALTPEEYYDLAAFVHTCRSDECTKHVWHSKVAKAIRALAEIAKEEK